MQAFIVRPFGVKQGLDFDKVEELLIIPSLIKAGIQGSTTAAIMEAGNIREDMFQALLTADIVVADLTIHNANVFYELGIRHALRDKKTYLIRSSGDEVPFDLKTDRYLSYNKDNPELSVNDLSKGLIDTINSARTDSPVFLMLPKLEAQNPEKFLPVPNDFGEEVEIAKAANQIGKLALLVTECESFSWSISALRFIGEVQLQLKIYEAAMDTWEKIRTKITQDFEANDRLATIYQRLAEAEIKNNPVSGLELFTKSDNAIERIHQKFSNLNPGKRAEVFSLKARNSKSRWIADWRNHEGIQREIEALLSIHLFKAFEDYESGYYEDLNHYYSGINALSLLVIIISLAERHPSEFISNYPKEKDAEMALEDMKQKFHKMSIFLSVSVEAENIRLKEGGKKDVWLKFTEADLECITKTNPTRVGKLYRDAISLAGKMNIDAAKRQLEIYQSLRVLPENVEAAISEFQKEKANTENKKKHYILFSGHMIDDSHREIPRFPKEKEEAVKAAILKAVEVLLPAIKIPYVGIAGGACGGDILFHEACQKLNIPTVLHLAIPRNDFIAESVSFAGHNWVQRFNDVYNFSSPLVLADSKELPVWLRKKKNYGIWERNNLWMLYNSLVCGGQNMTLIALWDGKAGDGYGGTEHMIRKANEQGAKTVMLDINSIS